MSSYKPLLLYLIGLFLCKSVLCDNYKSNDLQLDHKPPVYELTKNKISHENISEITRELLKRLTSVKNLEIEHSNVRNIEPGALDRFRDLTYFSLRHNLLEEVKNWVFNHSSIEELDLSNNQIRTIEDEAFTDMWNLEKLNLKNNKIEVFSNSWFKKSWFLRYVNFGNNLIKKLPRNILNREWTSTTPFHFIFSHNRIEEIDEEAFVFIWKIDELYLDHNVIKTIENNTFSGLEEIKVLRLDHNQIVCTTADFSKVKDFNVHDNPWDQQCLANFKESLRIQDGFTTSTPTTTPYVIWYRDTKGNLKILVPIGGNRWRSQLPYQVY